MFFSSMIFFFLSIILPLRAGIVWEKSKAPGMITERLRNIPPTTHANAPRQGVVFISVFESLDSKEPFTTLIDHFTRLGYQVTNCKIWAFNSINKATEVANRAAVFRHSTRLSVWPWLSGESGRILLRKTIKRLPIEMPHSNRIRPDCQSFI